MTVSLTQPLQRERDQAVRDCLEKVRALQLQTIRVGWMDLHGHMRSKWLTPAALESALNQGVTLVSTLALKDTSGRTAWPVFDRQGVTGIPGFGAGNNLLMWPRPESLQPLPWAPGQAWLHADLRHTDGSRVSIDGRSLLSDAVTALATKGWRLRVGLELEFHVYKVVHRDAQQSAELASWPGAAPEVVMLHPGYQLLNDSHADACNEVMQTISGVAQGLGLPLLSVEIEMGPSQFEAVFAALDAMAAADAVCQFREGVRQALARLGYHASFVCRPPFESIMSSGWHVHHSLVDAATGANVWAAEPNAVSLSPDQAQAHLSPVGAHWLAGLLDHAAGLTALAVPTTNGYARFQPNALAPQAAVWDVDNRSAMLRVLSHAQATRIENRLPEPNANPYWLLAAHIWCGLDGVDRALAAPAANQPLSTASPVRLPQNLSLALEAMAADSVFALGLGSGAVAYFAHIKRAEVERWVSAPDRRVFEAREYFALS
jgi:glutamine synthetase